MAWPTILQHFKLFGHDSPLFPDSFKGSHFSPPTQPEWLGHVNASVLKVKRVKAITERPFQLLRPLRSSITVPSTPDSSEPHSTPSLTCVW